MLDKQNNHSQIAMDDEDYCKPRLLLMPVLLSMIFFMSACENDIETIYQLTAKDEAPFEISHNIELVYSEHGNVQIKVKAPLLERYVGEEPYMEMRKGIEVIFYDSLLNVTTNLTANYAISYENDNITEARNDVVVTNQNNERLNTEHLIWDEKKEIIYSDVFVAITTETEVIYGDGFISDDRFEKWSLKNPKGTFIITDDDTEE